MKAGALPFKGAVYVLPYSEEHYELLQWLTSEVNAAKGDGAFVQVTAIETMSDRDIIELFNQQRVGDYRSIDKGIEEVERKLNSIKKGGGLKDKRLTEQFHRYTKEFEEIRKIDFFSSPIGSVLDKRIKVIAKELKHLAGAEEKAAESKVVPKDLKHYQNMTWATRKRPFIDRMASAWLIKRLIDKNAVFSFIDERQVKQVTEGTVTFDIPGGVFTHRGDLCTFEVLVQSFALKDKALKKIAEIVHELDIKDETFRNPESQGIEEILQGIRKTARSDLEALEKGMEIFEMLYASKA